jgi:competence protein ComEC
MQTLEKISLFSSKKDFFLFLRFSFFLLILSLSYQYYNYHELTKFDSQLLNAVVLKQYTKTKTAKNGKVKKYEVLKLISDKGYTFYTIASTKLPNIKNKDVKLEVWAGDITFYAFMHNFFTFSKILKIYDNNTLSTNISHKIAAQHHDTNITAVYEALFLAKPLPSNLQKLFSNLGISHLIAISGFHLGILSFLLFFIIKYPYKFLQNRYFPYRSYHRDSFIITAFILLIYMLFISSPPSLLRAYVMLLIGFLLYDRGMKIISMQTLLITVILVLALFPRLLFSIGFWLSVSGVFYIFLFFIHFQHWSRMKQFVLLPFWVYLMMLPYSLAIFGNFSLYHPLSILYSMLFTLFYPLALFLHLVGFGDLLDTPLQLLLNAAPNAVHSSLAFFYLTVEIILSLFAVFNRKALYLLFFYALLIFIHFIYQVA